MNPSRISMAFAVLLCASATANAFQTPELTLTPDDSCYPLGSTVTVSVDLSNAPAPIVGGQFTLSYDKTKLTFVSADPAAAVWTVQIFESVNTVAGTIDYSVGIPNGGTGATSGTMATLTFTAAAGICNSAGLVAFRANTPPTKIVDSSNVGYSGANLILHSLPAISIDSTNPIVTCPAGFSVQCAADVPADVFVGLFSEARPGMLDETRARTLSVPQSLLADARPGFAYRDSVRLRCSMKSARRSVIPRSSARFISNRSSCS